MLLRIRDQTGEERNGLANMARERVTGGRNGGRGAGDCGIHRKDKDGVRQTRGAQALTVARAWSDWRDAVAGGTPGLPGVGPAFATAIANAPPTPPDPVPN